MDNHFECMWDMFRDVPSIETPGVSVLDEYYWLNKRDPREGKVTTGGIVTVKDSTDNWYLSWTINRQPQFKAQDKNTVLIWVYALTTNKEGNYVKKAMRDCTGEEVCREWLYHIGVPTDQIDELPLSLKEKLVLKKLIKAVEGTDLEILLKESGLLR